MSTPTFLTEAEPQAAGLRAQGIDAVRWGDASDHPERVALWRGPPTPELLRHPGGAIRWIPAASPVDAVAQAIAEWFDNDLQCVFLEDEDPLEALQALGAAAAGEPSARRARADLRRHCALSLEAGRLAGITTWDVDVRAEELSYPDTARAVLRMDPGPSRVRIRDWIAQVHPEDRSRLRATIAANVRGKTPQHNVEYRVILADGSEQHMRVSGLVTATDAQGAPLRLSGTAYNVTDLRQAEAKGARAAQRLEAMSWASGEFIFELDAHGVVTFVTPSVEAVLGWSAAELIGVPLGALLGDREARGPTWTFNAGCGLDGVVAPVRARDGRPVWLEVTARPAEAGTGAVSIGVARDVTALEAARRQLVAATAEAEAGAKARAGFLSSLSRDIRTPLNDILGLAELMATDQQADAFEPRSRAQLETIRRTGEGLIQVLDDVLDLTKMEHGALDVARVAFSPEELCAEVTSLLAERAHRRGVPLLHEVKTAPDGLPSLVLGDPGRLRQMLLNLVGNAIKFTEQGHITLAGRYDRAAQRLELRVEDTGVGIAVEQQSRLFQPFHQANASVERRYGGTGLGLAITQRLAEAQQGSVELRSRPGAGSTFTLALPAPLVQEAPAAPPLAGRRALLVGASGPQQAALQRALSAVGVHQRVATGPAQALATLGGGAELDWLILDLPGGVQEAGLLLRVLRAAPSTADLPVIALGGGDEQPRREGTKALGLHAVLAKPLRPNELIDVLHAILNGGSAPRAPSAAPPPAKRPELRVLLVEDNPVNQEVARLQLERLGATVEVAADGQEALEALDRGRFALVLMDCQMPRMDGYTATRAIRRRPDGASLPIVALTANAMLGDRERCLQAGMDDYLSKPVRQSDLAGVIQRWVTKKD